MRDLRISVTDRCNFRCTYCMPREHFPPGYGFLPREELLSFEELHRVASVAVRLGVEKIRITGGEPLMRRDLHRLISMLAALPTDLALTTNGVLLQAQAERLAAAGLRRVTVSLDALDDATFSAMSDSRHRVSDVLAGIEAAARAGLVPLKVNAVIRRGVNEHSILPLVEHFSGTGHVVRFIEYMDVGTTNAWDPKDVVSAEEILARIGERFALEPVEPTSPSEVATRYRRLDGGGEIGVIASVTRPFCSSCTRVRLASDGKLHTCLFSCGGVDLKGPMRAGCSDGDLLAIMRSVWEARQDRYSALRFSELGGTQASAPKTIGVRRTSTGPRVDTAPRTSTAPRVEMSYIGG